MTSGRELYVRWLQDCTEAAQELKGCIKQTKMHRPECCNVLGAALAAVMSLQQAVVLGCVVESKTQDLPELFAETMSTIELAKSTVQVTVCNLFMLESRHMPIWKSLFEVSCLLSVHRKVSA